MLFRKKGQKTGFLGKISFQRKKRRKRALVGLRGGGGWRLFRGKGGPSGGKGVLRTT